MGRNCRCDSMVVDRKEGGQLAAGGATRVAADNRNVCLVQAEAAYWGARGDLL